MLLFVWIIIAVINVIIEAITLEFFAVFFAASAIVSMIEALIGLPPIIQILTFALLGITLLIIFHRMISDKASAILISRNERHYLGHNGVVVKRLSQTTLLVKFEKNKRRVRFIGSKEIKIGDEVIVVKVDEKLLYVDKIVKRNVTKGGKVNGK